MRTPIRSPCTSPECVHLLPARSSGRTVAAIVELPGEKVLLTMRAGVPFKGYWCLPGGKVGSKETIQKAVLREVKEETGLDTEIVGRIGEYHEKGFQDGIKYDFHPTCFILKPVGGLIKPEKSEVKRIVIIDISDIPSRLAFDHRRMIEDYIQKTGRTCGARAGAPKLWTYGSAASHRSSS